MTDELEEPTKWDVIAAVKRSGLHASDRLIMMMLADAADADTAIVPEQWTPSLTELAEWTGLGRSTVATRLKGLEKLGWVTRERPATADALGRGDRTCYHLHIGQDVEKARPSRPANPTRPAAGPVQPLDQGSPDTELVQPLDGPSPAVGPPLVQPLDGPSPAAGHKNQPPTGVGSTHRSHQDPPEHTAHSAERAEPLPLPVEDSTERPAAPPKRRKRVTYGTPEFDAFWEIYPRKDDRKPAWKAWEKAIKAGADPADIIAGAERYRDDPNRSDEFTKQGKTWLGNDCWENGPLPPRGDRASPTRHTPYQDPPTTDGYRKSF